EEEHDFDLYGTNETPHTRHVTNVRNASRCVNGSTRLTSLAPSPSVNCTSPAEAGTRDEAIRLSEIVPVYNGAAVLETCLSALGACDDPGPEVLVVYDGWTQPIEPIVARHGFRYMR